jgi:hypothetical protein
LKGQTRFGESAERGMFRALPLATASAAGAPERLAGGAAATCHLSRGQIMSRKRETTKPRKPETKCHRVPEPEPSLMHSLHDSTRRGRGHGRSGTVPGTAPCAAVRAAASPARQAGPRRACWLRWATRRSPSSSSPSARSEKPGERRSCTALSVGSGVPGSASEASGRPASR